MIKSSYKGLYLTVTKKWVNENGKDNCINKSGSIISCNHDFTNRNIIFGALKSVKLKWTLPWHWWCSGSLATPII